MANEQSPEQQFAPLPVRERNSLEVVDAAIKLYRRYFGVLILWSCICNLPGAIPVLKYIAPWFTFAIEPGVAVCCVAAAVRGQAVTFKQCWAFTKPRFWATWGMSIVSWICLYVVILVLGFVFLILGGLLVAFISVLPKWAQITTGVIGGVVMVAVFTIVIPVATIWTALVQTVVCMEQDKRNSLALQRAFELIKKHWLRMTVLMTVFGLGVLVVYIIVLIIFAVIMGLPDIANMTSGNFLSKSDEFIRTINIMVYSSTAVSIMWSPFYYLMAAVLYLDLRVRKEALDLEWAAHTTAPTVEPTPDMYTAGAAYDMQGPANVFDPQALNAQDNRWVAGTAPQAPAYPPGDPPQFVGPPYGAPAPPQDIPLDPWAAATPTQPAPQWPASAPQVPPPPATIPTWDAPAPITSVPAPPSPAPPSVPLTSPQPAAAPTWATTPPPEVPLAITEMTVVPSLPVTPTELAVPAVAEVPAAPVVPVTPAPPPILHETVAATPTTPDSAPIIVPARQCPACGADAEGTYCMKCGARIPR